VAASVWEKAVPTMAFDSVWVVIVSGAAAKDLVSSRKASRNWPPTIARQFRPAAFVGLPNSGLWEIAVCRMIGG